MTIRYHCRNGRLLPDYNCQKSCVEQSEPRCQCIPGAGIHEAIGELLVQSMTPLALEAALGVQAALAGDRVSRPVARCPDARP